jgi:phage FluMu protein Com
MTYTILENGRAIRCEVCGKTSWNLNDVAHLFCGHCKRFHER